MGDRFERLQVVAEGGRDEYLYRYACSLRAKDVSEVEARELVLRENEDVCKPPISGREAEKCLMSAYQRPAGYSAEVAAKFGRASGRPAPATPGHPSERRGCVQDVPDLLEGVDLSSIEPLGPPDLTPAEQFRAQFAAMFEPGELANVVLESANGSPCGAGEMVPADSLRDPEAAEVLLSMAGDCGAWVRANPTDGGHERRGRRGEGDADVTALRNVLVEVDPEGAADMSEEELAAAKQDQLRRIIALRLPCACLVDSGNKSVHAVVRVADPGEELDREEWERRRDLVYRVCDSAGLRHDPACKNPSRLIRLAGAVRGGKEQSLLGTNCGAATFEEWAKWVRRSSRGPSIFRTAAELTGSNVLAMPPDIVDGVIAEREVSVLVGASGSGKSWIALQLAYAVATGKPWLGIRTHARPTVYIDAEITAAAFSVRMERVRRQTGAPQDVDMKVLTAEVAQGMTAAQLVEAIHSEEVRGALIVLDCLYVYEEADENDNQAMGVLLKTLKKLCLTDGDTLFIVHHTSKGLAGGKAVVDRGAGAGVLGRFCNNRMSLIGLDVPEGSEEEAELAEAGAQAYRLEMVLRDHPRHAPVDLFYTGSAFVPDTEGLLASCRVQGSPQSNGARAGQAHAQRAEERWGAKADLARSILMDLTEAGEDATTDAFLHRWHAGAAAYGMDGGLSGGTLKKWLRPSFEQFPFVSTHDPDHGSIIVPA